MERSGLLVAGSFCPSARKRPLGLALLKINRPIGTTTQPHTSILSARTGPCSTSFRCSMETLTLALSSYSFISTAHRIFFICVQMLMIVMITLINDCALISVGYDNVPTKPVCFCGRSMFLSVQLCPLGPIFPLHEWSRDRFIFNLSFRNAGTL